MSFFREYKHRCVIPLVGAGMTAYYLFVFVPLAHHAEISEAQLRHEQTNAPNLDLRRIVNEFQETTQTLAHLNRTEKRVAERLELGETVRERMKKWDLDEYEGERSRQRDELDKLAKQQKVTVEPAVLAGLPAYTADMPQPELLWASLAMIDGLLTTAIQCKVDTLHSLEASVTLTNAPATNHVAQLVQLPLQLELTGTAPNVARLIQSLPLRAEELRAAGLPACPTNKPPLFVDRLILKKQSPDKPDEVRATLRVVGFVLRQ